MWISQAHWSAFPPGSVSYGPLFLLAFRSLVSLYYSLFYNESETISTKSKTMDSSDNNNKKD